MTPAAMPPGPSGVTERMRSPFPAARRMLTEKFRAAGLDSPELDARILVGHALSLDHAALAAAGARILDAGESKRYRDARRPPTGARTGRTHRRQQGILEPDAAHRCHDAGAAPGNRNGCRSGACRYRCRRPAHTGRCASPIFGTGSGALLLALLTELPNAIGVGTDTSLGALRSARDNARRLQLARAAFVACDMGAALGGPFDLIVSNPPYIASGDIAALRSGGARFRSAAGARRRGRRAGLLPRIAATAAGIVEAAGALIVELGAGQASAVSALFAAAGLAPPPARTDLQGVPRALVATRGTRAMTAKHWP